MVEPFRTSYGVIAERNPIIVRVSADGHDGWAECPADVAPSTNRNPIGASWSALEHRISKDVLGVEIDHPLELTLSSTLPRPAAAAVEMAIWDLHAKIHGLPLWHVLGGSHRAVRSGVVVGIAESIDHLTEVISRRIGEGYQRVKLKIGPGWDLDPVEAARSEWPDLAIAVDANGAYQPDDTDTLRLLDRFQLEYLEQPFKAPDIEQSAILAESMSTPICLDESLSDRAQTHAALVRSPHFVVNAKPSRLGGHSETLAVHRLAVDAGADLWCGGYLETGIGRAHLVAMATLPGFSLAGDLSASSRYWRRDLVTPEWTIRDGALHPTKAPGIGVDVDSGLLEKSTTRRLVFGV